MMLGYRKSRAELIFCAAFCVAVKLADFSAELQDDQVNEWPCGSNNLYEYGILYIDLRNQYIGKSLIWLNLATFNSFSVT